MIKRYNIYATEMRGEASLDTWEEPKGEWVKYEDIKHLLVAQPEAALMTDGGYSTDPGRLRGLVNPEAGGAPPEVLGVIFCNMDENGDPVGAQPESPWEKGYAAGLRYVYRTMKAHGISLPPPPQRSSE